MAVNKVTLLIAAAALACLPGLAIAQKQSSPPKQPTLAPKPPLERRGTVFNQHGVTRKTSSANQRYALPSVKIQGIGVKSSAPRGIGKKGGSLLPDYQDAPPPRSTPAAIPDRRGVNNNDPWGGRLYTDRYGRVRASPVLPNSASQPRFDPDVLRRGDSVEIARMLRPAIDYSFLPRFDRFRLGRFWPCGARGYFMSNPNPYAFNPDTFTVAPNSYVVDRRALDPFVQNGSAPATPARAVDPEGDLNGFEKAGNRLYEGKPEQAIVLLRAYTDEHPDDVEAVRALALALIDARRTKEGVELIGRVYADAPDLASSTIPPDAVGPENELRDLVVRVVEYAHKANTSEAWLTVAVLMQAEGRREPALKMLDRADAKGLRDDLSRALRTALKP